VPGNLFTKKDVKKLFFAAAFRNLGGCPLLSLQQRENRKVFFNGQWKHQPEEKQNRSLLRMSYISVLIKIYPRIYA
jgi:hypothetical protein